MLTREDGIRTCSWQWFLRVEIREVLSTIHVANLSSRFAAAGLAPVHAVIRPADRDHDRLHPCIMAFPETSQQCLSRWIVDVHPLFRIKHISSTIPPMGRRRREWGAMGKERAISRFALLLEGVADLLLVALPSRSWLGAHTRSLRCELGLREQCVY